MATGGLTKIAIGAEAVLYRASWLGKNVIVKVRVSKAYRHPEYDRLFRFRRTIIESRVMTHLKELGLNVPSVYYVDPDSNIIVMEYIDGSRLSDVIESLDPELLPKLAIDLGRQTCIMHKHGIYHGDLTIANIILSRNKNVYIIDFGLAGYSRDIEEYAIDIHLLSRSLLALSPHIHDIFMKYFRQGYEKYCGHEYSVKVFERVKEIRLRGRYIEERLRRKVARERYL